MKRLFNTKKLFTLIEIAVAMSIFAILMLVMMQIFGSLQNVWRRTNARITTTEDARLIMRIIKDFLQQPYKPDTTETECRLFYYNNKIERSSPESPILWIATKKTLGQLTTPFELAIYAVEQNSTASHKLYQLYAMFTEEKDNDTDPTATPWDFKTNPTTAYQTHAKENDENNPRKVLLLENIVNFTIEPVPTTAIPPTTLSKTLPARYRILVKILNDPTTASIYEKNGEESLLRTFTLVVENKIVTD